MTTPATTPATLEEIRRSFLQAEATLSDLADALTSLRSSSEQFDDARGGLQNASQRILDLAGQVAATAQGISASIELLREGVRALEKCEPTRMLSALDQLSGVEDRTSTTLRESVDVLARTLAEAGMAQAASQAEVTRAVQELSRELGDQRTANEQTRSDTAAERKRMLLAIMGIGVVIVSLQLWQLFR